jgi:hypothetical protein
MFSSELLQLHPCDVYGHLLTMGYSCALLAGFAKRPPSTSGLCRPLAESWRLRFCGYAFWILNASCWLLGPGICDWILLLQLNLCMALAIWSVYVSVLLEENLSWSQVFYSIVLVLLQPVICVLVLVSGGRDRHKQPFPLQSGSSLQVIHHFC